MGTRITNWISRYWKRKTNRPDYRQAYIKLPLDTDLPALATEFERVCEGRLDRVPRRDSLVVDTDFVPDGRFDAEHFAELVAELKARAPGSTSSTIRRSGDDTRAAWRRCTPSSR